jgi:hypothetical protein
MLCLAVYRAKQTAASPQKQTPLPNIITYCLQNRWPVIVNFPAGAKGIWLFIQNMQTLCADCWDPQ